ncbi:MAG: major facilitator superfamily rane protein [Gemmatimonadetes bacterium]|nr:major facilitator superfamily rane protein [Gemmatimonadota bacterium]
MPETGGRLLRGNVLWLSVVSFLNDSASEMIYPLLPLFLTQVLGVGPAFLGVLEGVTESASSLLKLAGGWFADRFGRRKPLMVAGYAIATFGRPLIGVATAGWQVLGIRFADRVGKGLRSAPRDALLTDSVPEARRGAAFGIHRAADHAGAVVGPLMAAGLLYFYHDRLRLVFLLAIVPGLATLAALLWKVREEGVRAVARDASAAGLPRPRLRDLGPAFPRYLAVLFLFTLGNASDAFLLLRARDAGVADAMIPLLWGALHVSKMTFNVLGGRLGDRIGPRIPIVAGWLVYAGVYAGFAVVAVQWQVWALFLVYGLFYGLTEPTEKALVASIAPAGQRGSAFGAYHFAIGLGALPASLIFGLLWERMGAPAAFGAGAALALVAALLLPLVLPRGRGPRSAEAAA